MVSLPRLTLGMACFNGFAKTALTANAIRMSSDMRNVEFVFSDNNPDSPAGEDLRDLVGKMRGGMGTENVQYYAFNEYVGTAGPRQKVFELATGEITACMDNHVLFYPNLTQRLRTIFGGGKHDKDLVSGPIVYYGMDTMSTHFNPFWRGEMHGVWADAFACKCKRTKITPLESPIGQTQFLSLPQALEPAEPCPNCRASFDQFVPWVGRDNYLRSKGWDLFGRMPGESLEVPGQGLGFFACKTKAWPGFNPHLRGFGGEELYIHEKIRRNGGRVWCYGDLAWWHLFRDKEDRSPDTFIEDKIGNTILTHEELEWALDEAREHFVENKEAGKVGVPATLWDFLKEDPTRRQVPKEVGDNFNVRRDTPGPNVMSPEALFEWGQTHERDLNKHFVKMREYALKCRRITEFSKRRESTIPWVTTPGVESVVSYNLEYDLLIKMIATGRYNTSAQYERYQRSPFEVPTIAETDLLFLSSKHDAKTIYDELTRYAPQVRNYIMLHSTANHWAEAERTADTPAGQSPGPGMREGVLQFLKENQDWTVHYGTQDQWGLLVLTRLAEDKQTLPSLPEQGLNYFGSWASFVLKGGKKVSEEDYNVRLETCMLCPVRNDKQCGLCGCYVAGKAVSSTDHCPLKKWPGDDAGAPIAEAPYP